MCFVYTTVVRGQPIGLLKKMCLHAGTDWLCSSVSQRLVRGQLYAPDGLLKLFLILLYLVFFILSEIMWCTMKWMLRRHFMQCSSLLIGVTDQGSAVEGSKVCASLQHSWHCEEDSEGKAAQTQRYLHSTWSSLFPLVLFTTNGWWWQVCWSDVACHFWVSRLSSAWVVRTVIS